MNNRTIAALLVALAGFAQFFGGGSGGGGSTGGSTADIAARVHRQRAAQQAVVYRDVADRIASGALADAPAAGAEVVRRIAEIEETVGKELSADAAKNLPDTDFSDRPAAAAWFRAAADGFERVAK